ncbi:MAG: elongation factor G [SAR202 cluster bacterium]|nr:elongation factor G [SAR202 cluster bacterium]
MTTNTTTKLSRIRNIGFIAHIDAGKTTVTERVLFFTGRIHKVGNVDEGTTTTDFMAQERERGITIMSAATNAEWKGYDINVIDTPGHVDFTAEVERSLRVLDGGVVIFDAVAGVQPQSETVWRQADKYKVPRICFINKMDRVGANYQKAIDSIIHRLRANPVAIQLPIGSEDKFEGYVDLIEQKAWLFIDDNPTPPIETQVPEDMKAQIKLYRDRMIEKIAETDDALIVKFLEGEQISEDELKAALRKAVCHNKIVPVMCGSALRHRGVQAILDAVVSYLPSPLDVPAAEGKDPRSGADLVRKAADSEPFSALAFKVVSDPFIGRLVYIRVYSGTIKSGSSVYNATTGKRERLGRLVKMHADRREDISEIGTGQIAACVGAKDTGTGDTLCDENSIIQLESINFPEPVISVAIEPKSRVDQEKLGEALNKLASEDPTLKIRYDDETGQTVMSGMGELHLEIIVDRMKREFKVEANVGRPRVAYREAIRQAARAEGRLVKQSGGHGQYGHVWLEVEPLPRGEGYKFVEAVKGGSVPKEFFPAVQKGVVDALTAGPLGGYPVVDVLFRLVDGSYHDVDSSEMAFRAAAQIGAKAALSKAKPVILEPVMKLEVTTPGDFLGDILGDLSRRRANIRGIEGLGDTQVVRANVPLGEAFGYANTIRSLTQGRASYTMEFESYEEAPASVIAAKTA